MPNKINVPALWSAQTGAVVAKQQELAAGAFDTNQSLEALRSAYETERAFWNEGGPQMHAQQTYTVDTKYGQVPVTVFRPEEGVLPVIVFAHGGGFTVGSVNTHNRITRTLAALTGAAVVSVDYTLSPEAHYPQPVEEIVAVVQDLRLRADELHLDTSSISFAGDSGGANLVAGPYLHLREVEKDVSGLGVNLFFYGYFGLDDSISARLLGGEWDGLTEADIDYYWGQYLGAQPAADQRFFKIVDNELKEGFLPSFIAAADLDPLRDNSELLSRILTNAGIANEFLPVEGVIHGFLHNSRLLDAAGDTMEAAAKFYKKHVIHN
ncbi:hypothetical protein HMPREF2851_03780 [Actinomyces sp. HMSC064C12]|nr:hypothetical protein HMPREF2851_03780 [Actinomyces sp. HMSC064C12]